MYKNKCSAPKNENHLAKLKIWTSTIVISLFICFITFGIIHDLDKTDTQIQLLEFQIKDLEIIELGPK